MEIIMVVYILLELLGELDWKKLIADYTTDLKL